MTYDRIKFVVFEMAPPKGMKEISNHAYEAGSWYLLGVLY